MLLPCSSPSDCSYTHSEEMGRTQKIHGFFLCRLVDLADLMLRELCKYKVVLGHHNLRILTCIDWRNCIQITWGELLLTAICNLISIYNDA